MRKAPGLEGRAPGSRKESRGSGGAIYWGAGEQSTDSYQWPPFTTCCVNLASKISAHVSGHSFTVSQRNKDYNVSSTFFFYFNIKAQSGPSMHSQQKMFILNFGRCRVSFTSSGMSPANQLSTILHGYCPKDRFPSVSTG